MSALAKVDAPHERSMATPIAANFGVEVMVVVLCSPLWVAGSPLKLGTSIDRENARIAQETLPFLS